MSTENTEAGATEAQAPAEQPQQQAAETAPDLTAEVDKWKALARKNEERAKANSSAQAELDKLREATATEQDKAIAQARKEASTEAAKAFGSRLAEAQFRVAAAGRLDGDQLDGLLEVVDLGRFVDENGDPDIEAITAAVSRVAPKAPDGYAPDEAQGARSATPALNSDALTDSLRRAVGAR